MLERNHSRINISRQAEPFGVSRTSACRVPADKYADSRTACLMHRIDALNTAYPFYGYRRKLRRYIRR